MKRAATLAFIVLLAWPGVADAADDKNKGTPRECTSAAETSQLFRNVGKLIDARNQLLACIAPQCPKLIQNDCNQWLSELDGRIPTVVVSAVDSTGAEINDVTTSVDGVALSTKLDGRAISIDPGPHHMTFTRAGAANIDQDVTVKEGERARAMRVRFAAAPVPAASSASTALPVVPIVLGAVGAAGLATFFIYHFSAKSDVDDLRSACAPGCSKDAADTVDRKILVSHVALGVGITALVGAALTYFYPRLSGDSSSKAALRARAWNTF